MARLLDSVVEGIKFPDQKILEELSLLLILLEFSFVIDYFYL
jgi:hypothetical protein